MQLNYFEKEVSVTRTGRMMRAIENTAEGAYDVGYEFCENYERPYQEEHEKSIYRGNLAKNTYWKEYGDADFLPYIDVKKSDWFYTSVYYNYENKLMTGMQDVVFGPYESLSRAQFATILYRMDDSPEITYEAKFKDVTDDAWYADAVLWAARNGIVTGYLNGNFGPADMITREQMGLMMYRFARYLQVDTDAKSNLNSYRDAANVSGFAKESMEWAVGSGLITGKNNGTLLDPQGNTARAECAAIIQRFAARYE